MNRLVMLKSRLKINFGNGISTPVVGIFAIVFISSMLVFIGWDWVSSVSGETDSAAESPTGSRTDSNGIPLPNLDDVQSVGSEGKEETIRNPFADPAGLTGETDETNPSIAALGEYDPKIVESFRPPAPETRPAASQVAAQPAGQKVSGTKTRLEARGYSSQARAVPTDSTLFDVSDLVPLGRVSGGSGPVEVIFRSISLERNIALPVGSKLHDGRLHAAGKDGVSFIFDDSGKGQVTKPWGRGISAER